MEMPIAWKIALFVMHPAGSFFVLLSYEIILPVNTEEASFLSLFSFDRTE